MRRFVIAAVIVSLLVAVFLYKQGDDDLQFIPVNILNQSYPVDSLSNENTGVAEKSQDMVSEREHLFEARRKRLADACSKLVTLPGPPLQNTAPPLLIDKKHFIYYCPIPKCGSTFWKGILLYHASEGKYNKGSAEKLLFSLNDLSNKEVNFLLEEGRSFIFVREPYSRLLSGYVNKLYLPHFNFWKNTGLAVVKTVRKNYDHHVYKQYGFDVTFSEFIKYMLYMFESGQDVNPHFAPMYRRSNPCSIFYRYIGKLETFNDDSNFLLAKWTSKNVSVQYKVRNTNKGLRDANRRTNLVFRQTKPLGKLDFPYSKFVIRSWRDMQIRGYISKHIDCPYRENMAKEITRQEYLNAMEEAVRVSANRTDVKKQRKEALIQAYRQISVKDMERLSHYVKRDCMLFGYDDRPKELFDMTITIDSDFNYLEGASRD